MRITFATAALAALLSTAPANAAMAAAPAQRDYTWFTIDQPSGTQTVQTAADGHLTVRYQYNDRGRGPDTTTEMTVDQDGLLTAFSASGLNYSKGRFEERFSLRDGVASWQSSLEQGQTREHAGRIYFPLNPPPEYRAVLARALLAQPDRQLGLMPAGSARINDVDTLTLTVAGQPQTATLYEISGLDLMPTYVWLDQQQALVGYDANWFALMRNDWAPHLAQFRQVQQQALTRRIEAEAKQFSRKVQAPIALSNVRVLDVEAGRLGAPATVLLQDGVITRIGSVDMAVPAGAQRVDGAGRTLMASLWDMHGHVGPSNYLHYVAAGVLNVRDMGNDPAYLARLRQQIRAGTIAAPDLHPMGFIDKRGPFAAPTGRLVDTPEEARAAVRSYAAEDNLGIKLYSSLEPAWVPELAREARALGLGTVGHIPAYMSTEQAIQGGYSEITHVNMILLQLIGDWNIDTRTPQRFIVPGERGGDIDLDSAQAQAFLDLMLERDVAHDPTLAIFMNQYRARPGQVTPSAVAYADHLPSHLRRGHIESTGYNDGKEAAFARTGQVALQLIKRMHERGIRILPGTDSSLPGFALVSELQYYAEAGIGNADVLRLATIEAARHVGQAATLGSVEAGKRAHLMLVDGDPTQDLAVLRKVRLVVKGDVLFDPAQILAMQGIRPFE